MFFYAFTFLVLSFSAASISAQEKTNDSVLLVLNKNEANLAILDAATMKVLGKVPVGDSPHEVVISADGKRAYVANYGAQTPGNTLSIIDLTARKELKRVDLGGFLRPHGIVEMDGNIYFTSESSAQSRVIIRRATK
jgi:YVTN family beta-propeller protein